MSIIRSLPSDVAAKIAAGEVVERPASVVKELVENSIDAGARVISVDVEDGGRKRITVTDDGCGMDEEDAGRSLKRYATSKISSESDLWRLTTMGFRGEALNAISAVSRFVIETRTKDSIQGARVEVCGGGEPAVRAAGCPQGTRVDVSDLFFNVPARQKFLKSSSVEFGHISDELSREALANPQIAFELKHNGRKSWAYPAARDFVERMRIIAASEEISRLVEIDEEGFGFRLKGWIGDDLVSRGSPKDFHIYVNRRPVRDRILMHAVSAGYESSLERGCFPVAAVFLEIDPSSVDVNVHPTKREVRFSNGPAVHDFIQASVRKALGKRRQERAFGAEKGGSNVEDAIERFESRRGDDNLNRYPVCHSERSEESRFQSIKERDSSVVSLPQNDKIPTVKQSLKILAQYGSAFLLCEDMDGALVVVDQHAAHEKLGFDELMCEYREGRVERQQLLFPQTLSLKAGEFAQYERANEVLSKAGFEVEPFGGTEIVVKAVPAIVGDTDIPRLFEKMFHELSELGSSEAIEEKIKHIFSVIACHRQVRAGDMLTISEMQRLVEDIENNRTDSCPHGRPAIVRYGREEVNKWFKR